MCVSANVVSTYLYCNLQLELEELKYTISASSTFHFHVWTYFL
jgi:hypothetical protein